MDRMRLPVRAPEPFGRDEFLLGRFTRAQIRRRVERSPYRQACRNLMRLARASAREPVADRAMAEPRRAQYARALAFSAWLTGSAAHFERAAAAMEAAGTGAWGPWCGAAEVLTDYALAWDFLRAAGGLPPEAREHFIERVGEKLAGGIAVNAQLPHNNWRVCALSGIGMMTLALWHEPCPWPMAEWLEVVMDGLSRLLFGLVSPDGVYIEGPGYSRRSGAGFLPFAWACTLRCGVDLVNFEPVARWMRWLAEFLYPDGTNPPIDDSRREALHPWPLLCHRRCRQARLMRWAADRQPQWHDIWDLQALLLYDDRIRPKPPPTPAGRILSRSGVAVFRSDWSRDATSAVLVARPLPPLGPGAADSAHRHEDPTNLLIFANGEPLTTEGGYGGWGHPERYSWFLHGEAHNIILVDGKGPPRCTFYRGDGTHPNVSTANGRIRKLHESRGLMIARAETDYLEVEFARLVAFVGDDYFVVFDVIDASAPHTYEWVHHGLGRLSHLTSEGALWRTRRSRLALRWVEPAGLQVSRHARTRQDTGKGFRRCHYVKAAANGKRLVYLTVLLPGRRDEPVPEVTRLVLPSPAVGCTVARGGEREHFVFNPWGGAGDVALPGRRPRRVAEPWTVFFERNGRLTVRRPGT